MGKMLVLRAFPLQALQHPGRQAELIPAFPVVLEKAFLTQDFVQEGNALHIPQLVDKPAAVPHGLRGLLDRILIACRNMPYIDGGRDERNHERDDYQAKAQHDQTQDGTRIPVTQTDSPTPPADTPVNFQSPQQNPWT